MTTKRKYGYCYFRQYLVLADQSLYRALKVLLFGYRRYRIRSLGISFGEILIGLSILLRQKLYPAARPAVQLPVPGDIALRVHRGHKVFDLAASTVTKVFAEDVARQEAVSQIDASRLASGVPAAPRFIGADDRLRWYTEEYVGGRHGTDSEVAGNGRFMDFYPDVEACLLDLVDSSEARRVNLDSYVHELTSPSLLESWNVNSEAQGVATEISRFQADLENWILSNPPLQELDLVLIHGDFSLVNVILDPKFRVIDWEGIRYGSLFGDLLNFVFVEKYYGRAKSDIASDIDDSLRRYGATVIERFPKLASAAEVPRAFALRIYYLERLKLMLERDVTANLSSVVSKSIHMFREFDAAAAFPELEEC